MTERERERERGGYHGSRYKTSVKVSKLNMKLSWNKEREGLSERRKKKRERGGEGTE